MLSVAKCPFQLNNFASPYHIYTDSARAVGGEESIYICIYIYGCIHIPTFTKTLPRVVLDTRGCETRVVRGPLVSVYYLLN